MTKTESRRRKVAMPFDIRKKFAAAICMLLIAAIMMISSSYAWFTLSTAPEVTGITTSIGANGNLEIALLNWNSFNSSAPDLGIVSGVGDSMVAQNKTLANVTWGNLVDLDDASYGLSNIILNPAALNITDVATNQNTLGSTLLMAPSYGSDGRVISVDKETVTGVASGNTFTVSDEHAGVRAIGVSSGITLRETSYRNALTAISTNTTNAKNAAANSLVSNGPALGAILVKVAAAGDNSDNTALSYEDVQVLGTILTQLQTANNYVATAIKNAALAIYLSGSNETNLTDEQVSAVVTEVSNASVGTLATALGGSVDSSLSNAIAKYNDIDSALNDETNGALTKYNTLMEGKTSESTFVFDDLDDIFNAIINKSHVTIVDTNATAGTDALKSALMSYYLSSDPNKGYLPIVMEEGSGIYYDIAKLAGNYIASPLTVTVNGSILPGLGINDDINITAAMSTNASDPIYLVSALAAAQTAGVPTSTGGATSIDDTYGYAIDFGFRTNAAGAKLLLQQEPKQRVYNANGNESTYDGTQGAGSYMQFTSTNIRKFSVVEMRALMSAVRVVFAIPTISDGNLTYEIVAMAAPEITSSTDESTGVKTYTGGSVSGENEDTLKVQLALYNYTASVVNGNEVTVTLGAKKTTGEVGSEVNDVYLTDLEQNVAKKLTAIVYIDGDLVDNTMVANANTSMTGTLNLQFATDVDLVPMENTALRNGGSGGTSTTPTIPNVTTEQLQTAVNTIKGIENYATNSAEGWNNLRTKVTAAETVLGQTEPAAEQSAINTAAYNLAVAYAAVDSTAAATLASAMGITLP